MKKAGLILSILMTHLFLLTVPLAFASNTLSPGFLVIAPDRGYQGNREIRDAFEEFRKRYDAALAFISLNPDDEDKVRTKLKDSVTLLRNDGAKEVVLLPLVLADSDPPSQES